MNSDNIIDPFHSLEKRIDELTESCKDTHNTVNEIKLRLFNGLTDTARETYSKVLLLEHRQTASDGNLEALHKLWIERLHVHDIKETRAHFLMSGMLAFIALFCAGILTIKARDAGLLPSLW